MSADNVRSGDARPFSIDGDMTIYRAAELKQCLLEAMDGGEALALDLSGVTEIDTAGVQLLLAAIRYAEKRQQMLRIAAISAPVAGVLRTLNLADGAIAEGESA